MWTQRLVFHPHVHCLVTGGGLSEPAPANAGGATWHPAGKTFLFPKTALSTLARARFRDAFVRLCPDAGLPPHVWRIPWVVHITPWGEGQQAALDYLARYAFRIAITNNRILAVDDETVTYRYKDRAADPSARKDCPATNSSAAFSSASCRPASTSFGITASGTPPAAKRCAI